MKPDALTDMFAILTAGGRNGGEQSRALPKRAYGDPADNVEFPAELERQKKLKNARMLKSPKCRAKGR